MRRRLLLCTSALMWVVSQIANAASYEIIFEEGAFQYYASKSPAAVDNKYLARVTVKKDGDVVLKDLRGSTLPDAWVFYQHWNVELKRSTPPTDADIASMFQHFERQTSALRDADAKLGNTNLADIADILDVLNRVPALKSGRYPFVMGLHKGGQSVHGNPHVPRLLGGDRGRPYDPTTDSASTATTIGGFVRTLNKNNAQDQKNIAAGINVHDGRTSKDYKDSEGCLTIRPQDWKVFHEALPSPSDWVEGKHNGIVSVRREAEPELSAPMSPMSPGGLQLQLQ